MGMGGLARIRAGVAVGILAVPLGSGCSSCGGGSEKLYVTVNKDNRLDIATLASWGAPKPLCSTTAQRHSPNVAPGGTHIAYVESSTTEARLHVMKADCSDDRVLATGAENASAISDPSFSPDGQWVAYTHAGRRGPEIAVVGRDGGVPVVLSGSSAYVGPPTWSPDSSSLAFVVNRTSTEPSDLYVAARDGSALTALTKGQKVFGKPGWSSDGKIAFGRITGKIRNKVTMPSSAIAVMSASALGGNGDVRDLVDWSNPAIVAESPDLDLLNPGFSPDASWLAFTGHHNAPGLGTTRITSRVFLAKADGSAVHAVVRGQTGCFGFRSNTKLLAVVVGSKNDRVMLFPLDGGDGDSLASTDSCPAYAPPLPH